MIEIDLGEVDARHDEAVLVGRKFDTSPLNDEDILVLLRCVSDVPLLMVYALGLERRLKKSETKITDGAPT